MRARALIDVPTFRTSKNGAIRILIYPCTSSADYWLGGLSDIRVVDDSDAQSRHNDIADYEWTFPVVKGRSRVILADGKFLDGYAYSAAKIADCSAAQDMGVGLQSGLDFGSDDTRYELTPEYGFAHYRGAICVEVKRDGEDYCGIYVCVSGATEKEDEKIAMKAIPVIKKFFEAEDEDFTFNTP